MLNAYQNRGLSAQWQIVKVNSIISYGINHTFKIFFESQCMITAVLSYFSIS